MRARWQACATLICICAHACAGGASLGLGPDGGVTGSDHVPAATQHPALAAGSDDGQAAGHAPANQAGASRYRSGADPGARGTQSDTAALRQGAAESQAVSTGHGSKQDLLTADEVLGSGSHRGREVLARSSKRTAEHGGRAVGPLQGPWVSTGQVRPFVGDIYPTPSLVLALESRAFKRELILITDTRLHAALQTYGDLAAHGLVNALWLTSEPDHCTLARPFLHLTAPPAAAAAAAAGVGAAGRALRQDATLGEKLGLQQEAAGGGGGGGDSLACAWYSQPFPSGFVGHRRLMLKRLMVVARSVRLGYNVLNMDTDVLVLRNPFPYLKAPPFDGMHLVVGKGMRPTIVNTGFLYVQNAARHGPVSWLFAEAVDRNLRWIEANVSMPHMEAAAAAISTEAAAMHGNLPRQADTRGCWDQFLLTDLVLTGLTKKLVYLFCLRPPASRPEPGSEGSRRGGTSRAAQETGPAAEWDAKHRTALNVTSVVKELFVHDIFELSDSSELRPLVADSSYQVNWVNITVPHGAQPLLPETAYPPGMLRPGVAATAFQDALKEDTKHTELRLRGSRRRLAASAGSSSSSDSSSAGLSLPSATSAMERVAYAPEWLVGSWLARGVYGYWDPGLAPKPKQVMGHLVRAPGSTGVGKDAIRMAYGLYDWALARQLAGGPGVFLSSTNTAEMPRVVAYAPSVDMTTESSGQYAAAVRGLAQVALLTGRRMAWPEVPCNSGWLQRNPGARRALPLVPPPKFLAHGTFTNLRCGFSKIYHPKCLYERRASLHDLLLEGEHASVAAAAMAANSTQQQGSAARGVPTGIEGPRGLLQQEFEELLRLLGPAGEARDDNTLVFAQSTDDYSEEDRPIIFDEPARTEGITYVKASDVAAQLGQYDKAPVLYLGQRTFLTKLDKLGDPIFEAKYRTFKHECPALLK